MCGPVEIWNADGRFPSSVETGDAPGYTCCWIFRVQGFKSGSTSSRCAEMSVVIREPFKNLSSSSKVEEMFANSCRVLARDSSNETWVYWTRKWRKFTESEERLLIRWNP